MSRRKASDDATAEQRGFITGDKLSQITGYTDVWHRKAAKEGYFPPPVNGLYKTVPTLQGLFKRERDMRSKSSGGLSTKREKKLDKEIALLEIEISKEEKRLISIDEVLRRLESATAAARQAILSSTLTDEEKENLFRELQRIYRDAGDDSKDKSEPAQAPQSDDA